MALSYWLPLGGKHIALASDNVGNTRVPECVLSGLRVWVTTNTSGTSTLKLRIGTWIGTAWSGSDGNQAISITGGTTGWFADAVHTDTASDGQLIHGYLTANQDVSIATVSVDATGPASYEYTGSGGLSLSGHSPVTSLPFVGIGHGGVTVGGAAITTSDSVESFPLGLLTQRIKVFRSERTFNTITDSFGSVFAMTSDNAIAKTFGALENSFPSDYVWVAPLAPVAPPLLTTTVQMFVPTVALAGGGSTQAITGAFIGGATGAPGPAPIAYWPLNEGTGSTSADASGNGHTATKNSSVTWNTTTKKFGAAAWTDASGAASVIGSISSISLGVTHSVSLWANITGAGVICGNGSGDGICYISPPNDIYAFTGGGGTGATFTGKNFASGLHHFVITRNGGTVHYYVDNTHIADGGADATTPLTVVDLSELNLAGTLDDIRLYNVALTGAEVAALYTYDPDAPAGGPTLYAPTVVPGAATVIGATVATTLVVRVPTIAPGPVAVTGASVASTSQAFAPPTLAVGAVTVSGATLATTMQLFAPALVAVALGATITSTAGAFPPSAAQAVSAATCATTIVLFAPTLAHAVALAHQGTTLQVFTPTVAPGPVSVTAVVLATTAQVFEPVVSQGAVTVALPTLASTMQMFTPSLVAVALGATITSTSGAFPPSTASVVAAATCGTTVALFAPTAAPGVALPQIGTTAQLFVVSVAVGAVGVTTGALSTTEQVFAPLVSQGAVLVLTATLTSTAQVFAAAVSPGAATVAGATCAASSAVFAPVIVPFVFGATVGSGSGTFAPALALTVTTGTAGTTAQVFAATVAPGAVTVTGGTVTVTTQIFAPTLGTGAATVVTGTVGTTAQVFGPTLATQLTGGTCASTSAVSAPTLAASVTLGTCPATAVLNGPVVLASGSLGGSTVGAATQIFAPTVAAGPVSVTGGTVATTVVVREPSIATLTTVTGATIGTTVALFGPTAVPGPVASVGATVPSTAVLSPPTVLPGSIAVTAGHCPATSAVFAPTSLPLISVPALPSTAQVFAPIVIRTGMVTTPALASTAQVFVPFVSAFVSGMTVSATSQVFAPVCRYVVAVPALASGLVLFAPTVFAVPAAGVVLPTIVASTVISAPSVDGGPLVVTTAFVGATSQAFAVAIGLLPLVPDVDAVVAVDRSLTVTVACDQPEVRVTVGLTTTPVMASVALWTTMTATVEVVPVTLLVTTER